MRSPRVDFKYIRTHPNVTFEAVAAHYGLELQKGGADPQQQKMLCPFHDDHKPSLNVNVTKKNFHCFPCGAKGNVVDFVAQMEQIQKDDIRKAFVLTAEICGVETSALTGKTKSKKISPLERVKSRQNGNSGEPIGKVVRSTDTSPDAENDANPVSAAPKDFEPYTRELPLERDHPYLASRAIDPETAEKFDIGYCKAGFQKGRVAIRLHDPEGNPLGYGGRWAEDEPPEDTPRYLLPKHFPKEHVLYNAHRLPADCEEVVLVESYWSVFRLNALGVPAVSTMGWALSEEHCAILRRRGIGAVVVLFDGDDAGRKGSEAAVKQLVQSFFVWAPAVEDGFKPHKSDEALLRRLLDIEDNSNP